MSKVQQTGCVGSNNIVDKGSSNDLHQAAKLQNEAQESLENVQPQNFPQDDGRAQEPNRVEEIHQEPNVVEEIYQKPNVVPDTSNVVVQQPNKPKVFEWQMWLYQAFVVLIVLMIVHLYPKSTIPNQVQPIETKKYTILLIGEMGVGKSTIGNELLGKIAFKTGSRIGSYTSLTNAETGMFKNYINITVIDTQGHDDSNGKDGEYAYQMLYELRHNDCLNAIVIVCNGDQVRWSGSAIKRLQLLSDAFGEQFWDNIIIVINFWHQDTFSIERRDQQGRTESAVRNQIIDLLQDKFNLKQIIPIYFTNLITNRNSTADEIHYKNQSLSNIIEEVQIKKPLKLDPRYLKQAAEHFKLQQEMEQENFKKEEKIKKFEAQEEERRAQEVLKKGSLQPTIATSFFLLLVLSEYFF